MFSEIPFPDGISLFGRQGISTFSLLLMSCFLSASYIIPRELKRIGLNPVIADWSILIGIVSGIIGAKIFFVAEVWNRIWVIDLGFWDTFYRVFFTWDGMSSAGGDSMWGYLFSGSGLVFYGGFICAFLMLSLYLHTQKLDVWRYADVLAMSVAFGYGIGRLGCFVSGDGCFGHVANLNIPLLTWIYGPEGGHCPNDPALAWKYPYMCTDGVRVWNTPVIEAFFSFALFAVYMSWGRYQKFRAGFWVALLFLWNAIVRFNVEFIRLNDAVIPILDAPSSQGATLSLHPSASYFQNWHWYGFTQAQLLAIFTFSISLTIILVARLYKRKS